MKYIYIFTQNDLNLSQCEWLEFVNDYDCEIHYHPGNEYKVIDALNRMKNPMLLSIQALPPRLKRKINKAEIELIVGSLASLTLEPIIFYGMKGPQSLDPDLVQIMDEIHEEQDIFCSFWGRYIASKRETLCA